MFTYSTCSSCGDLLHVTIDRHHTPITVHPDCTPQHTKLELLALDWRDAVLADDPDREAEIQCRIDELDDRPPRLLDAAVRYAQWGWPVFPLKPASKQPATKHGFKDATTDTTRIAAWWTTHPDSNIGLSTGHAFDVIDIDPPEGTYSYLKLLADADPKTMQGDLPDCHGQVTTASGGLHLYVKPTGDGNATSLAPGIDYRGAGGYVVAPPSTLERPHCCWSWTIKPSPVITGAGDSYA